MAFSTTRPGHRKGAIAVLTAMCLVILMAMVVFAIDLGYILMAQTDLQRTADAAAHAAVLEYRSESNPVAALSKAREIASQYVQDNQILNTSATVSKNWSNTDPDGDIVVGRIDFDHPSQPMTFGDIASYNAVRVRVRRNSDRNGEVSLFFAHIFGHSSLALDAEATAAVIHNVGGFAAPRSGEAVPFLPITIRQQYWENELRANSDQWSWDPVREAIGQNADSIPEVVLFPNSTGSSGNFGALNVGTSANGTGHIARQIRNGLSQSDLDYHGGELKLDENGELLLTGTPGLRASLKDDLEAMRGEPRIIPLYTQVSGDGNNGLFTITKFVGVRVMAVRLNGGEKYVTVQPANVTFKGALQADPRLTGTSEMIYSPPVIVQ